ncbi:MAG: polysaccharide biosynthesis tyrosine autokinase [Candidatus Omnitrophota bacterium]
MTDPVQQIKLSDIIAEDEKPIDLKYYIHLVLTKFSIVLTFLVIGATLSSIYAAKIPKKYQAKAQIILEQARGAWQETEFRDVVSTQDASKVVGEEFFNTQKAIMLGNTVLGRVVDQLKLTAYFEAESPDVAIEEVLERVKVEAVRDTRLVNIVAEGKEPEFAAELANSIAQNFIEKSFEDTLYYNKEILTWLEKGEQEGSEDEYITITSPLGKARKIRYEELIDTLPAIKADPAIIKLDEQIKEVEVDLNIQLLKYREKHPVIIKLRAQQKNLTESIAAEKKRIIEGVKQKAEGQLQVKPGRIVEKARPPAEPVPARRWLIILVASAASVFISLFLIFLMDYFDDTIHIMEDFERKGIMIPFLGPIPLMLDIDSTQRAVPIVAQHETKDIETKNAVQESFRYIRVAINFSAPVESVKTLLVTSCLPADGKSFVSTNLASSLALDGNRVLLVDADMRKPTLNNSFGMQNEAGLSNYLTSNIEFESILRPTPVENLQLICSGPISPNPSEILGSERMKAFLREADKRFDRIIIDSAPLTGIGDGFVIGNLVGHMVLVVSAAKTPAELIRHTQQQIAKVGIKVLGVVLNRVDFERSRYGGFTSHYYSTYNKYYKKK